MVKKKLILLAGALAAILALPPAPALAATAKTVTLDGGAERYRGAIVTLSIAAGDLQIQGAVAPGLQPGSLLLQGVDVALTPQSLQAGPSGLLNETLTLPAGTYTLSITPTVWQGLRITGQDLTLSTAVPQLSLGGVAYQNANEGLTLQPTVTGASALLWSGPGGSAGAFSASGSTFAPLTIPTNSLAEGLYLYTVIAPNTETGNAGIALRPILIDRQDSFTDLPASHWSRRWVEVAYHLKIVTGRPDGTFAPEADVTRGEFAKLLAATLGLEGGTAAFVDVKGHWASAWIQSLGAANIVQGDLVDGKRYFYPDKTITRQEAAAMVARAFSLQAGATTPTFTDWSKVESWAQGPVSALVEQGWITGFPDGTFGPRGLLSRSQAAKILGATFGM